MPQNPNSQQIANPKPPGEPQVKGPEMNDRDRLQDLLATEKYLTDSFNVAAREASHDALFRDVLTVLTETHRACRDVFNLMFQKGWYKLEAEQQQKVDQAYQQFSGYSSQFPYPARVQ
ncbi:spore coat protein [Alicyclobacillus macrosporangiidus]|jgi:spore coat protein CotF|uniref:Coat F domain-containing protein n=1 Tax=Alicyclobacillus macrosporangiidus TaxID=392015 RepID=A0A1I7KWH1_9BACL|nr:spore coat protein [Alicyclobacillus macrosporangiidus]SFV01777.1 Coat F domain-containing protein [Alicyclobacillus macrosporangiidus]